jgi:hypothetical protein
VGPPFPAAELMDNNSTRDGEGDSNWKVGLVFWSSQSLSALSVLLSAAVVATLWRFPGARPAGPTHPPTCPRSSQHISAGQG